MYINSTKNLIQGMGNRAWSLWPINRLLKRGGLALVNHQSVCNKIPKTSVDSI